MSSQRYDVFISFRGEQSAKDAHLIYYALKSRGYNAFLDVIELTESGRLKKRLKEAIANCENFVPLLSPGALDERAEEMDWVRYELETAHELHKKTIPVVFEGFKFPKGLPDNMKSLMNRVRITFPGDMNYIKYFIDELIGKLKSKPRYILNQAGEISDSWPEILAAIDDGTVQRRYAIGAWKPLDLGRFGVVNMQLAGFKLDKRADGYGKAATTWIARDLLAEEHVMYKDWERWDEAGWESSYIRKWLQNVVLPVFPNILKDRLISVKKQQKTCDKNWNGHARTTADKVWIPDYPELFGNDSLYYDLFKDKDYNRVKTRGGSTFWWWQRSVYGYYNFLSVGTNGANYNYTKSSASGGVALGFCL